MKTLSKMGTYDLFFVPAKNENYIYQKEGPKLKTFSYKNYCKILRAEIFQLLAIIWIS